MEKTKRIENTTGTERGIHYVAKGKEGSRPSRVVVPAEGHVDIDTETAKIIRRQVGFKRLEKAGIFKMTDVPKTGGKKKSGSKTAAPKDGEEGSKAAAKAASKLKPESKGKGRGKGSKSDDKGSDGFDVE